MRGILEVILTIIGIGAAVGLAIFSAMVMFGLGALILVPILKLLGFKP